MSLLLRGMEITESVKMIGDEHDPAILRFVTPCIGHGRKGIGLHWCVEATRRHGGEQLPGTGDQVAR